MPCCRRVFKPTLYLACLPTAIHVSYNMDLDILKSDKLTLNAPIAKKSLLFSSAEMFMKPLWQTVWQTVWTQSLFWLHAVCFYT